MVSVPEATRDQARLQRVETLFPELEQIESDELRRQVAEVWLRLWDMSGYADLADAVQMPYLPERRLVNHTRSVTLGAIGMARALTDCQGIEVNMDRLIAASILHDASKCVEFEQKPDGSYGRSEIGKNFPHSYIVTEVARQVGISDDVAHLIAEHSPNSPLVPRHIEGPILRHADLADSDCVSFARGELTERVRKGLAGWLHQDIFD